MQGAEVHDTGTSRSGTGRIDAFSDGVFAIAFTLLTFDVVAASRDIDAGVSLLDHLVEEWPTLVSFVVGVLTILVCWINHQCVFASVRRSDSGLLWVNGVQLALVSIVPFPTAVLADNVDGVASDRRTALLLYGVLFWLIATSFLVLWRYVTRRGLADTSSDPVQAAGMGLNYGLSSVWTLLCLAVASVSAYPALVMWGVMFVVFAVPTGFARVTGARRSGSVRVAARSTG